MVKFIILLLLASNIVHANEAQVLVLEAPLFAVPNEKTKVVQYLRKGAIIYVHPAEVSQDRYEGILETTYDELVKHDKNYTKEYKDKLFPEKESYIPAPGSRFYKTIGKSGADAYILKDHVFLLYKDAREFDQKVAKKDPTDYRIDEPLPKDFPFIQETGYRGQTLFSLGTPATSNYPYRESIKDTGFDYNKELIFVWSRQVKWDLARRFFFGGMYYVHSAYTKHTTENIAAGETTLKMGAGPLLAYDVWKDDKYILNMYGSIMFNFYDNIKIDQNNPTASESNSLEYDAIHFGSRVGTQFFVKNAFSKLDFVMGVNLNIEMPFTYQANSSLPDSSSNLWKKSYQRDWTVQQSYFAGVQFDY